MKNIKITSVHILYISLFVMIVSNSLGQVKQTSNHQAFGKAIKVSAVKPPTNKIRCITTEYEQYLQEKNPSRMSRASFEKWLNPLVSKYKLNQANSKTAAVTIITIPVVIHIAHSGQNVGVAPNITDAQVQSQITVLNQDFRKMAGTPGGTSTNPVAADVEIEFVLAKQDPAGNPTNGIERVKFLQPDWTETDIETILKPATIWDPSLYLNMWSVKFSGGTTLGFAQFPESSGLAGLDSTGKIANTDGVVSSYDVFGSKTFDTNPSTFLLNAKYDRGRTMTHEVGHYLGLLHIWGDGNGSEEDNKPDCIASDYCNDTPQSGWEHYTCGTFDTCPSSPGKDMPENYMDYTEDECMNIFTQNQKDRMLVIMNNAARRKSLKTSTKGNAIPLFALDAEVRITSFNSSIDYGCLAAPAPINKVVTIANRGNSILTSVKLNYTMNDNSNQVYTWNGSLAPNKSVEVALPNTNFKGTLNVSIAEANGGTDQRISNNTSSKVYTEIEPVNYDHTNYVFRLQRDLYASETTWELTNSTGAVLYSGGPYADSENAKLPSLLTENWTLPSNLCYTFTISDSQDDGICCGVGGNGYYDIKTKTGGLTIKSGSNYLTYDTITFTNDTLGTTEFGNSTDIYLYPNPAEETLNVLVPNSFGLPNNLIIVNALGQKISQKIITKETDLIINTSELSGGVYFIVIIKNDQERTLRFIKK